MPAPFVVKWRKFFLPCIQILKCPWIYLNDNSMLNVTNIDAFPVCLISCLTYFAINDITSTEHSCHFRWTIASFLLVVQILFSMWYIRLVVFTTKRIFIREEKQIWTYLGGICPGNCGDTFWCPTSGSRMDTLLSFPMSGDAIAGGFGGSPAMWDVGRTVEALLTLLQPVPMHWHPETCDT